MRVGISLLTLVPGAVGGSETYVRELTRALAALDRIDVQAFVPALAPDAANGLPTTVVEQFRAGRSPRRRAIALALATARPGPLRRRYAGIDAVHYPLTVPVPRLRLPTVITLHDLQHRDLPAHFGSGTRAFRALAYDRAARRADAVIVISEFVRERAIESLRLDPGRVHAVPLGVDHERFRPAAEPREPFVLYPARPWPHKNHTRLLEAFALLRAERPELRLVLTGAGLEQLGLLPDGVERRGHVSSDELAHLYRRASCLVFPSLYEGFGLPPLEAMASGCPVAASSRGALPEVCGEAAVLFDPEDPDAIAAGVLEAIERADELRAAGRAQAARYTWEACAQAHVSIYRSIA